MNSITAKDNDSTRDVIELITGGWRAQALYVAVKLKLPDHINAGNKNSTDLAIRTGASRDGIHRLMRLLVSIGVFKGNEQSGFKNTSLSSMLQEGPHSLRDMCLLYGEECYAAWKHAYQAISTESSGFEIEFGKSFYTYLGQNEEMATRFQHVMNAGSMFFHKVPDIFDFSKCKVIVDIGGGGGQLLSLILEHTPNAQGILFDNEQMMPEARKHITRTIGTERVEFVAGDMFKSIPKGGDVYLMSRVLAGWDDKAIVKALKNCRRGFSASTSRLIIIDRLIVDEYPSILSALWDLQLLMTNGGKHRTLNNFEKLLNEAGFGIEHVTELPMQTTAIIATGYVS
jgi:hypothetical protein